MIFHQYQTFSIFCRWHHFIPQVSKRDWTDNYNKYRTNVVNRLNAKRLSLDVDTTNFMVFRPKWKNQECPNIQINGSEIKEVSIAKFLDGLIDNKLSWAEHFNHIWRKV